MNIPKDPQERRGWIIWQLRNRGWSLSRVARAEGVSVTAVSIALLVSSRHIQEAIADRLDLTPQQLFPEFYDIQGQRLGNTRGKHRSTATPKGNVEERART